MYKNQFSELDYKLIELIRQIGFGEIKISITRGRPVLVKELQKSIRLDKPFSSINRPLRVKEENNERGEK